ncbi:MAG: superoxide dismutase [Persicimonas sp.]
MAGFGEHTLPDLPYAYDALEPYIDEQTMRLHHDKHHQGYVNGLNSAERKLAEARESGDFSNIRSIERAIAFNGSGHINHTLFWENMCPADQSGEPEGALADQIAQDFGSLDNLKAQFSACAGAVEGSGWGILIWNPEGKYLSTIAGENHQKQFFNNQIPILLLDVWEHAYYLKYQNNRGKYVEQWWNVVNWDNVAHNFDKAQSYEFPVSL